MLEFEVIQKLEVNAEILEIMKDYIYNTKKGKVKYLLNTNLQFIEQTEYIISSHTLLTILEYEVNELFTRKVFYSIINI